MLALLRYLWEKSSCNTTDGSIIVLVVLCSLLQNLSAAFQPELVSLPSPSAWLWPGGLALQSFHSAAQVGSRTIDSMVSFMQALPRQWPAARGREAVSSAAIFSPLLLLVTATVGTG